MPKRIAEVLLVLGCVAVFLYLIVSVYSTRPSRSAARYWQETYSSILPAGYSDFRALWQHQDIGVHIFSFRYPEGLDCEGVLKGLEVRLARYRVHERRPGELALRRSVAYSKRDGFDEFRFVCVPTTRRVYAMFANLDSEMEAHPKLVKQLRDFASGRKQ